MNDLFGNTDLIWQMCLLCFKISIVSFITLLIVRAIRYEFQKKSDLRKDYLRQQILVNFNNPLKDIKSNLIKDEKDYYMLAKVTKDMFRNLKGRSYYDLLELLENVGYYDWLRKTIKRGELDDFEIIKLAYYWVDRREIQNLLFRILETNNSKMVKLSSAQALINSKDESVKNRVFKYFDQDDQMSFLLISLVIDSIGSTSYEDIENILSNKNFSKRMKKAALNSVSKDSGEINLEIIYKYCIDKDPEIRILAFRAFTKKKKRISMTILQKGSSDSEDRVRKYCARTALYSFPESLEILYKLADDDSWIVGLEAIKSIFLSGDIGLTILRKLANNENRVGQRSRKIMMENLNKSFGRSNG